MILLFNLGLVIGFFNFLNSIVLDPYLRKIRVEHFPNFTTKFSHEGEMGLKTSTLDTGKIWYRSKNYFFSYAFFDKDLSTLIDVSLYFFDESFNISKIFQAPKMNYVQGNQWTLQNGLNIDKVNGDEFPRLQSYEQQEIFLNEVPEDFIQIEYFFY